MPFFSNFFFFFCNFLLQLMCWGRKIQEESAFQRKKDMSIIMKILKKLGNKGIEHYKRHVWKMTENLIICFKISNSLDPHLSKIKKEKKNIRTIFNNGRKTLEPSWDFTSLHSSTKEENSLAGHIHACKSWERWVWWHVD